MLPKLQLSAFLLKRLESVKQECTGCLFGVFYDGTLLVMGLNVETTIGHYNYEQIQHKFPAELDLCGLVKFGEFSTEETDIKAIFRDVDITDNPLLLHLPELGSLVNLRSSVFMHGRLLELPYEVMTAEQLYSDFCFTRLKCGFDFYTNQTIKDISHEMHRLRTEVSDGNLAFRVEPTQIYITNAGIRGSSTGKENAKPLDSDAVILDVIRSIMEAVQSIGEGKENGSGSAIARKTRSGKSGDVALSSLYGAMGCSYDVIDITVMRCKTRERPVLDDGNSPTTAGVLTAAAMGVQQHKKPHVYLPLNTESLAILCKRTKTARLYDVLIESVCRSLRLFEQAMTEDYQLDGADGCVVAVPCAFHFFPEEFGHFLTCAYLEGVNEDESVPVEKRKRLHRHFGLCTYRPYFRRANGCLFRGDLSAQPDMPLLNPHIGLRPSGVVDGQQYLVQGNYFYYHYMQQEFSDKGWGCAYRSLQTICSWFKFQGYTNCEVPKHREIQRYLVGIGDKQSSFEGSTQWIGSTEVSMCLQGFMEVDSIIKHVTSGADLATLAIDLATHFQRQGTPIMIGGGVLAHTIIGVDHCAQSGEVKFLILDPHYTGADDLQTVQAKGWCGWKGVDFWDKKSYYNLCLPQRPLIF